VNQPSVSVCLITYNHRNFIREAIEGVLMQQVNFPLELIIADDFSTDGTREIIYAYKDLYPELITIIPRVKNLGAAKNWIELMNSPRFKYVAYFEGDDYWTDRFKLQKQVDFLETHPEYVGCFHNTEERYDDDDDKPSFLYCNFSSAQKVTYSDLSYSNLMPTCSIVYKNGLYDHLPAWFETLPIGDWPMHLLHAQFGDFWYMPKIMAVHRLHKNSVWMLQDAHRNNQLILDTYEKMIKGFSYNQDYSQQLVSAKLSFMNSSLKVAQKQSFKKRFKNFVIRMIERL